MRAPAIRCIVGSFVHIPLVAAVRGEVSVVEGYVASSIPNPDAFVTTHNWRCKSKKDGTPACVKSREIHRRRYSYCKISPKQGRLWWDFCTLSQETTTHGKTCKDIEDVQVRVPSNGSPFAECETTDGRWDFCRYPAAELVPDADYRQMKALCNASQRVRGSSLKNKCDMNGILLEEMQLEQPSNADLNTQLGQRKWCDWRTAGWNKQDRKLARQQHADEWLDARFRMRVLGHIVKSGTRCCTSYNNNQLQGFRTPDNFMEYLDRHKTKEPDKSQTAIFVLGPSAAGKTSIVASLAKLRDTMAYEFPAMTLDGADAREVSEVWKRYAQDGGRWQGKRPTRTWVPYDEAHKPIGNCLLSKYFGDVAKPNMKKYLKKYMFEWIEAYKPKTVLIPTTAVPCLTTLFEKACKILKTIKKFMHLGYTVKFVIVYAPLEQVRKAGMRRALTEGKPYSSSSYALALFSAKKLYKKFRNKAEFIIVNNTWRTNQLPEEISWKAYQRLAWKAVRQQIQELR